MAPIIIVPSSDNEFRFAEADKDVLSKLEKQEDVVKYDDNSEKLEENKKIESKVKLMEPVIHNMKDEEIKEITP